MGRIEFIIDKNLNKKVVVKNSDNILKEYRLLSSFDSQYIIKPISINGNQMVLPFYEERCADGIAGFCNEINVEILEDNSIMVKDNGRGIPLGIHPKMGIPAVEVVYTILHAGGKFGGEGYKISGGLLLILEIFIGIE